MSHCYNARTAAPADPRGAFAAWGPRDPGDHRPHGLPFGVKALAVVGGFLIFKPLGLAALVYFWATSRRGGFRSGFGSWRGGRPVVQNSAFAERRRETLERLDEEAKAFAEFEQKQRQAHEKEAFDRFLAERGAGPDGAPKV